MTDTTQRVLAWHSLRTHVASYIQRGRSEEPAGAEKLVVANTKNAQQKTATLESGVMVMALRL
uniref:Uncharacterized protein n=1 Tax=Babesia bovis TaxID=5865 RepID=S6BLC9_BABBO|nr:hypothetical protein [Babesia bovis]